MIRISNISKKQKKYESWKTNILLYKEKKNISWQCLFIHKLPHFKYMAYKTRTENLSYLFAKLFLFIQIFINLNFAFQQLISTNSFQLLLSF